MWRRRPAADTSTTGKNDTNTVAKLGLLGELRHAIDSGDLEFYHQPKVSLATGDVLGLEALVRWQHPHRDSVMLRHFIPRRAPGRCR